MPKLPRVTAREVVGALQRAGFEERRSTGGHLILRHTETGRIAVVPSHPGDLKAGTVHGILRQAGISAEEFRQYLR